MLDNYSYKEIHRMCNTKCFSAATLVAGARLILTSYVYCLRGYEVDISSHIRIVMLACYRISVRELDINEALYVTVSFTEVTNNILVESL